MLARHGALVSSPHRFFVPLLWACLLLETALSCVVTGRIWSITFRRLLRTVNIINLRMTSSLRARIGGPCAVAAESQDPPGGVGTALA